MRSFDVETFAFNRANQGLFHCGLRRLAFLVRRQAEIAIRDKVDCIHKTKLLPLEFTTTEIGSGSHKPTAGSRRRSGKMSNRSKSIRTTSRFSSPHSSDRHIFAGSCSFEYSACTRGQKYLRKMAPFRRLR